LHISKQDISGVFVGTARVAREDKKVGFVSSKRLPDEIFGFHWVPADTGIKRELLQKRKYSAKQYQKEINCVV